MIMKFPEGHKPRFSDFSLDGVLDETLREGAERCMFSIPTKNKMPLIKTIIGSGIKDVIFGSGPSDPADIAETLKVLEKKGMLEPDLKISFILLLNCFEPLMDQFEAFPPHLKAHVTISFGMITHDAENNLFARTVERFRALGFNSFRVSLLNNFSHYIEESQYAKICEQINLTQQLGIKTVRINDSLGTLYPEAMAVLAANLRADYPDLDFCLHAHNDLGLGLQNALTSIYHGFNLIEGGFAEFGNRSGLPAIEVLNRIFKEKNIALTSGALNEERVFEAARLAETTFLVAPSLFRPVSGRIVHCENMGVTNIPSYLGATTASQSFINTTGLHDATLCQVFRDLGVKGEDEVKSLAEGFKSHLSVVMEAVAARKGFEYQALVGLQERFYKEDVFFSEVVYELAEKFAYKELCATSEMA